MKTKILFCLLILPMVLQSQTFNFDKATFADVDSFPRFGWVLDSVKWVAHDMVFSARARCDHSWVYQSDSSSCLVGGFITDVSRKSKHPFWQENKSDGTWFYDNRRKICRACLTEVAEHLVKYWRYVPSPKTEFEILKDQQKSLARVKHKYSFDQQAHTQAQYRIAWYYKSDSTRSGHGEWDNNLRLIEQVVEFGNRRWPEIYHFVEKKQ